jgi:2-polyprenyl-3-methyl-5-hydroxy-6-metoxy-1,4-benzoquinol methylase
MKPGDVGLFLKSARTDAALSRLRETVGHRDAFEALYAASDDPWASANPRYRYQRRKYENLLAMLPKGRRYARALDLGCGVGRMSRLLAAHADEVVGIDVAHSAVRRARSTHAAASNLRFEQGDVLDLPARHDGVFDLLVIADVLYYLSPLDDAVLAGLAARAAALLAPGGICLLANHFFFFADPDSRVSRRIHRAFAACPRLRVVSEHRRAFYLATMLAPAAP